MFSPQLILNADDFGLCPGVNQAVAELARRGIVTSASLLATAPHASEAVALARTLPGLGVGVHLCLIEEWPLSPPGALPTLAGPDGRLPPGARALAQRLMLGRVREEDIRRELFAQVAWVVEQGIRPTHVDSHQHTHVLPPVARVVADLLRHFNIPYVRNLSRPLPSVGVTPRLRPWEALGLAALARRAAGGVLRDFSPPAAFLGLQDSGHLGPATLGRFLDGPLPPLTELMAHPGHDDPLMHSRYAHWCYDWPGDLNTLLATGWPDAARQKGLRLVHYGELAKP